MADGGAAHQHRGDEEQRDLQQRQETARLRRRTPCVDSRRQPLCLAKPCVSRRPVFIGLTEEELELWLAPIVYLEFYNSLHGFLSFGGPHMVIDEQVMMPRKFNSAASAPHFLS